MTGRVHDRSWGQSASDSRDPAETANSPTSHGMEADHRRADIRARRVGRPCCSRERHQCQSGVGMAPPPCARPANGRCDCRRNAAGCRQRTVSAVDGARGADCDRQHTPTCSTASPTIRPTASTSCCHGTWRRRCHLLLASNPSDTGAGHPFA